MSADIYQMQQIEDVSVQTGGVKFPDGSLSFEEVYRRHGKALYNFLCYQLGNPDQADDVFEVVCERIFLHLRRYNPHRAPLVSWLFSIARNAVIDSRRRQLSGKTLQLSAFSEPSSEDPSPEEALLRRENLVQIARLVGSLARRDRDIISLKFSSGLSNQEIARYLGLREGNVAVILHRAIHRLRGFLQQEESHERTRCGKKLHLPGGSDARTAGQGG